ncbi:MAG: hypothetical protein PWQ97_124 [Tepidanaerobacteraceae bacterium]|nr:hypothetical protein [Tepidanaerobacteraceae bacterium]
MQKIKLIASVICIQAIIIMMLFKLYKQEFMFKIVLLLCILLLVAECLMAYEEIYRSPYTKMLKLLKAYRSLRHDFRNHLQVIYGMIQLKKYDLAINYINNIKKNDHVYDCICHLENPWLISNLLEVVNLLRQFEVEVAIDTAEHVDIKKIPTTDLVEKANKVISKLNETDGPKKVRILLNKTGAEFCAVNENSTSA